MKALLSLTALALVSCTGFQVVGFNPDGTPKLLAQVDATLAEGEGSAREIVLPNGIAVRSVQQRYDGTRVAGALIDSATTKFGLKVTGDNDKITRTFDGKAKLKGTKDPNFIPANPNETPPLPLDPNKP